MFHSAIVFVAVAMMAVNGQIMNGTMMMNANTTMPPPPPDSNMNTTMGMVVVDAGNATTMGPGPVMTTAGSPVVDMNTTLMMIMTTPDVVAPVENTTTVETITDIITDAPAPDTTTPMADPITTTPASPCNNNSVGRLEEIYQFTFTSVFDNLPENEQILVYEVLAAAEGCTMAEFINPETTLRIFRTLGSLPVRYVYIMINYMASALSNEGVVVPH